MSDVISVLESTALFRGLGRDALQAIIDKAERKQYDSGDEIIEEHAPGNDLYVILSGKVQISKTIDPVGKQPLHEFGVGDFFGEMALLDDMPRSAEVAALEACELLRIPRDLFDFLVHHSTEVSANILSAVTQRLRQANDTLIGWLEAQNRRLQEENERLNDEISRTYPRNPTSGNEEMQELLNMAKKAAASPITVLLLGESGTGKEVLARAVHNWSDRAKKPFIAINCAAIPSQLLESELFGHERGAFTGATQQKKGKFELADGGTAFLDEIGDMAEETQAKVLRFLQEQEFERVGGTKALKVDVRVIAATNRNLEKDIEEGAFREDLYYRLNVVAFNLLPLRNRMEDLEGLMDYFLARFTRDLKKPINGFADDVRIAFMKYPWPGNIRELSNVIERAVALSDNDIVTRADLPPAVAKPDPAAVRLGQPRLQTYQEAVENSKKEVIVAALEATNGNQSRASELLGLERTYLSRLMKQFGLR
jgi:transcriptional regulator with PAS, ATPase and Fis domain